MFFGIQAVSTVPAVYLKVYYGSVPWIIGFDRILHGAVSPCKKRAFNPVHQEIEAAARLLYAYAG